MNQAYNRTKQKHEDISGLYNGDEYLLEIASNQFKCSDETCNAELILCAYHDDNLVAPYFKTKTGDVHRNGCPNTVVSYQYDESDVASSRNVGQSAFNAMRKRFAEDSERQISLYNTTARTRTLIPRANEQNIRSRSSVKTGPVLYDGSSVISENTTYLSILRDGKYNISKGERNYLNFEGVGLALTQETADAIVVDPLNTTIVFISKFVSEKNNRHFSSKPNILVIRDKIIIHEQSWMDFR